MSRTSVDPRSRTDDDWSDELTVPFVTRAARAGWDQQRRLRRRRRVLVGVVLALVLLLTGTGVWLVGFSSVLDARTVTVERGKAALLTDRQIQVAAQVPLGRPVAAIDLQAVADRVATLPEVAEVTVAIRLPHTLTIAVSERTTAYALKTDAGYLLVDRTGVGYHRVASVPKGVTAVTADQADRALRAGLAEVVATLPAGVADRLTRIEAPTRDQVTLVLTGGVKVVWGSTADSALKSQIAVALLKVKNVKTVDVSAPSNPTTR